MSFSYKAAQGTWFFEVPPGTHLHLCSCNICGCLFLCSETAQMELHDGHHYGNEISRLAARIDIMVVRDRIKELERRTSGLVSKELDDIMQWTRAQDEVDFVMGFDHGQ